MIVAVDGGAEAGRGRAPPSAPAPPGADQVLELPRGGKVRAQDAARARRARAICWRSRTPTRPGSRTRSRRLAAALRRPAVGYACGQVRFVSDAGTNQEGVYWRYELWLRAQESALASVTAGNGAIYAVRREAYVEVDPVMGHDLSFPFLMVKRGRRAVYAPEARATEKMVPTIEGEWRRKRRMMSHAWPIVLRGGLLSPRGYGPLYALMIVSHRVLRYASPALHVLAIVAARAAARARGPSTAPPLAAHAALLAAALAGGSRARPAAAARALLRAHHRVARRRALRPPAPRHAGGLGRAGGHAVSLPAASARSTSRCGGAALLVLARRCSAVAAVLIRLESHGHPIYRQRRVGRDGAAVRALQAAHDGHRRRAHGRRAWSSTPATRASPASARGCAATRSTSCRT